MSVSVAILWVAIYIAVVITAMAIRSHLLFARANRVLRMSEMHGRITDRAQESTCKKIEELKETTTAEAREVKQTAIAAAAEVKETAVEAAKKLNEKIDTSADNVIKALVTGSASPVELHSPAYSNRGRT